MRGFKVLVVGLAAVVAVTFVACDDQPTEPENQTAQFKPDELGNGYPAAKFEYKLNILGVSQDKTADMDNNNGRRIFVMLEGGEEVTKKGGMNNHLKTSDINKIYLCNSTDGLNDYNRDGRCDAWRTDNAGEFGVIDANATDDNGALFGLPSPCGTDHNSMTACSPSYEIHARAKAGSGGAFITTCAEEEYPGDDNDIWCGDNGTIELTKQSAFKAIEITDSLLRMGLTIGGAEDALQNCIQGTTGIDYATTHYDIYLFDRCFENYFWNYDNNGLKNLELRFYWAPTS
ncbi:hypothetical protein ACFL5T_05110 [Gemmatimonadota bacterium]